MMKRLTLVLLLAGVAGCTPAPDPRGVKADEVLLQVSATGRTDARPDEARITVGVSTTAATAAAASLGNNATMSRVTAALGRLGVKPDDVQTRALTLSRIDWGKERGQFRAENMVEVRVRDLNQAGAAVAAATEAGGNVVSGPNLQLADPEAADNAAYAAAYKAARARAEAYAKAAGLKVKRVLVIGDGGGYGTPIPYGRSHGAANDAMAGMGAVSVQAAAPAPPVHAGASTREVRVNVAFALAK